MSDIFKVDAEGDGVRLDTFLAHCRQDLSRARIQQYIKDGAVAAIGSDRKLKASGAVRRGEQYRFAIEEKVRAVEAQDIALDIVWEDEDIVVIDKAPGMVVHPTEEHADGTLCNALLFRWPEIRNVGQSERPGIVHRLDAETSGLLIATKSNRAYEKLIEDFAEKRVKRHYHALAWAPTFPDTLRLDTPFGRNPANRTKFTSRCHSEKRALTYAEVLRRNDRGVALIACDLGTGRTHQIRVHLSENGAPILSDPKYGSKESQKFFKIMPRLALHAKSLSFAHPVSGEAMFFDMPYPEDFQTALSELALA